MEKIPLMNVSFVRFYTASTHSCHLGMDLSSPKPAINEV